MSEFISFCPKCRHQILCDTAYIGKRIACPVCLQEITMPEPPQQKAPQPASNRPAAAPGAPAAPSGSKPPLIIGVVVGIGVLVLTVGITIFALRKSPGTASPTATPPAPTTTAPAQAVAPAPTPAVTPAKAASATGSLDQVRAIWAFDHTSGNTVIDTTGNGYNATVVGNNSSWAKATNPGDSGLRLDGSSYAEVPGAVVNTAQSFSVSVWVNLDSIEAKKYQTFVSIDGNEISGFYLSFNPYAGGGTGRFEFDRMESDAKDAPKISAKEKAPVTTNTWYHLVGVYDKEAQSISIYFNGKLIESVPFTSGWQATGKTAIGRGKIAGHDGNYTTGTIRDVRFYAFPLTAEQVKKIAK